MVAPTGWFRGEGGVIFEMDLPLPEAIAQRVRQGAIQRVAGPKGGQYIAEEDDQTPGAPAPAPPTSRPPQSAPKAEWVAWAVVRGADPETAPAMSKGDLIDRYGREEEV